MVDKTQETQAPQEWPMQPVPPACPHCGGEWVRVWLAQLAECRRCGRYWSALAPVEKEQS